MASLISSNDAHLMMLEIVVDNVFVPWEKEYDQLVLKNTKVDCCIFGKELVTIQPNRRDYRSYRGSNDQKEKFYGGVSIVYGKSASFFEKEINNLNITISVMKIVADSLLKEYEDWGLEKCQYIGFINVPVSDLLNSIREQMHKRNKLKKHLSDFYKRQIISRSTMGTYTLLIGENAKVKDEEYAVETDAKITIYLRISYLGKSIVTEIGHLKSEIESFSVRAELDEEEPYRMQEVTRKALESGSWDGSFSRILSCFKCLLKKLARNYTRIATTAVADATNGVGTIAPKIAAADAANGVDTIVTAAVPADAANGAETPTTRIAAEAMYSSTITEYEDNKGQKSVQPEMENGTDSILRQKLPKEHIPAEQPLIWRNIIVLAIVHVMGVYLFITQYRNVKFWTWIFGVTTGHAAGLGITAGAHRLWAHRSYNAKLPLRILLMTLYCMAGQLQPSKWIRIHRTHHKYTDTSADPHDASRGFFYSHIGWVMMRIHPAVKEYGKTVDMSDVQADPVIRFADKYFMVIMPIMTFVLPGVIPVYVWNETWTVAFSSMIVRYIWLLNATCSVNSFAHIWGYRPYNRNIKPTENTMVSIVSLGEGWHNYHHCFPWDYKTSEFGRFNPSAGFIKFMARLGWAYDLKTSSEEIVHRFYANKGDGTPCPITKRQS
ncbi:acyl-CoA desaturase 2-like [Odontomachus brunneus]|uniref:acyl-CoA desaturase 2-like n=1 Tax=Odontomachus brunneus TaxID=486640 RepID=UPI0013F1AD5B|nr:acyl-CoA desaturase 2-like [Odontomachus brunneus]